MSKLIYFLLAGFPALLCCGADFPTVYNSETDTNATPLTPAEAIANLKLPTGFKATMFASEPDVQNPLGMAWDGAGRLWIAENYTYAERGVKFDLHLRDRILVFEDKDGDGHFDTRKVFTDEVQRLTSVAVGHGGVWAMCAPQLLFFPDKNGDAIPDGPAQVMLDGFAVPSANHHNFANGLHWGPDGWLYGRCGCSAPGEIGAPGTSADKRIPLRGAMWRFHPTRKVFEVVSCGTMNPWGQDWNEYGDGFFVNTVTGHLWQMIPGAHYVTAHTIDPNQRTYELIDTHANHWHFDTAIGWSKSRDGIANDFGGGHAHMGAMVYLGDNWPAEYRSHLFTLNFFGRRANQELLQRKGSGYEAGHGKDVLLFGDQWFRGTDLSYGPDGGVFVMDWSDTGECHESSGVHRTSGRIYKITYGDPKPSTVGDLTKLSIPELVKLQSHPNEWFARQARLQLADRATTGKDLQTAKTQLRALFEHEKDTVVKLRALWSLNAIGAADESFLRTQLHHPDEYVRSWAIRLLCDSWPQDTVMSQRPASATESAAPPSEVLKDFAKVAKSDSSAMVRLSLASVLQRLPVAQRPALAASLLSHAEDADDHNIPLMIWYGLIPLGDAEPTALAKLAADAQIPRTKKLMTRRLAEDIEKNPAPLNELLKLSAKQNENAKRDVLAGLTEGLRGWSKARKPDAWDAFAKGTDTASNTTVRERARDLGALFGDGRALDEIKRVALDKSAELSFRRTALQTLIEKRPPDLQAICEQLISVKFLNSTAIRGLALFNDPEVGDKLVESYRNFHPSERAVLMDTLVSRPAFAHALLDEVEEMRIPRADITPYHARQIRSFNDPALTKQLGKVWGELRDSPSDKQNQITSWKTKLTDSTLASADMSNGRAVFNKTCAACHTLYGHGGRVGPDLTGSGRNNLDYLLDNIVDPSAVVNADFRMTVIEMKDGRTLNGLVASKTARTLTLKTMTETLTLEQAQIESLRESQLSLMPEGLLDTLPEKEVRDLIAYLKHPVQVP